MRAGRTHAGNLQSFPVFRVAAGSVFVLAGAFAYYGVTFEASLALVLVIAGAAILIAVFAGHRSHPGDVAIFVIALLALAAVGSGLNFQAGTGTVVASYSATSSQVATNQVMLFAKTNTGSISIDLSPNASLGYQVIFRHSTGFPFFPFGPSTYTLTNNTRSGVFFLNASADYMSIEVTLGEKYFTNITASTGTGSVDLAAGQNVSFGDVSIDSGTGSVSANITAKSISKLYMNTGTGSVDFTSNYLGPSGAKVPITLSTGTGSVTFKANIPTSTAVSLNASTGLGSITHNLSGFTVSQSSSNKLVASAGDTSTAADSFLISVSTGTGSVEVTAQFV
jgi:hypothetical protein